MSTITLRLPDTQHERLKDLAAAKGVSLNKLLEELTARVIAEADIFFAACSVACLSSFALANMATKGNIFSCIRHKYSAFGTGTLVDPPNVNPL